MRMSFVTLLLLGLTALLPSTALSAAESGWAFALKGQYAKSNIENWNAVYPDYIKAGGVEISKKLGLGFDFDAGVSCSSTKAKALTGSGRTSSETVKTQFVPVELALVYRLNIFPNQIIGPYAGIGLTHTFYQQELNDDKRSGDQSGYHLRAGTLLLLDPLEPSASRAMTRDWHIQHTYLFIEYYQSTVDDFGSKEIDLGTTGYVGGFRFLF